MTESPGSPLSSIASDDMSDREELKQGFSPSASNMPPSKRRRTGIASWDRNTPVSTTFQDEIPPASPSSSISSDTSGDIPNSPGTLALIGGSQDDDYSGQGNDQVTVCRWEGCDAGDLGNMDDLVQHIYNEHVGSRQKNKAKANLRPECDRSFTRSDALAKHMRTVHETEALRPSDPVPKHHNAPSAAGTPAGTPGSKLQRIKLKLSQPPKEDPEQQLNEKMNEENKYLDCYLNDWEEHGYHRELGFQPYESKLPPQQLYRLLRRQIHWAEKETVELRDEWERVLPKRKHAFLEKEAIFEDVCDAELRLFSLLMGSDAAAPSSSAAATNGAKKQPETADTEMTLNPESESVAA
ncbi:unnamed protein product [Aspergillus oryzae]|uniref:Unnamed protein product n=1 Tax=Aspergillus oryzae TaxID=5062 RepID=A0AAN5C5I8_ASPOZ|nr:unnamed protein product [Aspergillus oryzae]